MDAADIDVFRIDDERAAHKALERLTEARSTARPERLPLVDAKIARLSRLIANRWPAPTHIHENTLKRIRRREEQFICMLEALARRILDTQGTPHDLRAMARGHLQHIRDTVRD